MLIQITAYTCQLIDYCIVERKCPNTKNPSTQKRDQQKVVFSNDDSTIASKKIVFQPNVAVDYNLYIGGVDIYDQLRSYFLTQLITYRNQMPLFFQLLDASIINVYLLCKARYGNLQTRLGTLKYMHYNTYRLFRYRLAQNLILSSARELYRLEDITTRITFQQQSNTKRRLARRAREARLRGNYIIEQIEILAVVVYDILYELVCL